tara:strand:- start:12 stop:287 length:276 start_codon:yes stop_codon:yes gene_type:complete
MSKATDLVDNALENHWLNLHEGGYDDEADEFQKAWDAVPVLDRDQIECCIKMLKTFYANEVAKPPSKREFDCRQIQSIIESLENKTAGAGC